MRAVVVVVGLTVVAAIGGGSPTAVAAPTPVGGPAAAVEPAPVGATVTHVPLEKAPSAMVVEPTTGRLFVDSGGATFVYDPDGTPVGNVLGRQPTPMGGLVYLDDVSADPVPSVVAIDPATLDQVAAWPEMAGAALMQAADGNLYGHSEVSSDGLGCPGPSHMYTEPRLDATTGVKDQVMRCNQPIYLGVGNGTVRRAITFGGSIATVSHPAPPTSGLFTADSGLTEQGPAEYPDLTGLYVPPVDSTRVFAASPSAGEVHQFRVIEGGWRDTGTGYPFRGTFNWVRTDAATRTLAIAGSNTTGAGDPIPVLDLFVLKDSAPLVTATLGEAGQVAVSGGVAPDGRRAYAVLTGGGQDPELAIVDLHTAAGTATPAVVGAAGGATIHVPVSGLPVVGATIGGAPAVVTETDDGVDLVAPARPEGPAAVALTNLMDAPVDGGTVRVADLGPYGEAPAFIVRQYADVVGRAPTGAETSGAMADLVAGGTGGHLVGDLIRAKGVGGKDAALVRLYRAVFRRSPDTGGYQFWLRRMQRGTRLVQVAANFAGSSEFQTQYGSLAAGPFVDRVYQNVLGRAADPSGRAHWIAKLAAGTSRGTLIAQFTQGSEYVRKTTPDVQRTQLGLALLRRTPTTAELASIDQAFPLDGLAQATLDRDDYPYPG